MERINRFPQPFGRGSLFFTRFGFHPRHEYPGFLVQNRKFILFAVIFIFLILIPVSVNKYYNYQLEAVSTDEKTQIFVIRPGEPTAEIAQKLKKAGLVKNALFFRLLVTQMGIGKKIQAGDFRLSPSMSSKEIAEQLT